MKLHVVTTELTGTATNLGRLLEDFTDQTKAAKETAEELYRGWEGERQKVFEKEQQNNYRILQQMAQSVSSFIAALNQAEDTYVSTDHECAQLIKST